jgi:hypothetical protein
MIDKSEVSLAPGKHSKINQNKTIHSTFFPTVLLFSAKYVNSQFLKRRIAKKSAQRIKKNEVYLVYTVEGRRPPSGLTYFLICVSYSFSNLIR